MDRSAADRFAAMVLAVVVSFLDEAAHLGELLASLEAQDRPPDQLLLVDDGSSDDSPRQARAFAERHPYARALTRPRQRRGADRLAAAAELAAFQWAVDVLSPGWDVVAKLDADLRLPPSMLRELLERLAEDPRLGIAGTFLREDGARIRIADGHVHGATKVYRRACFEAISPIPAILGWDTIDELRAARAGWRTRSFALQGGDPVHLRPRGSYDGRLRAHRRWGRCAYAFGEPPLLVAAQALRDLARPPRVAGGLSYGSGWAAAALSGAPRAEPELRAWVRAARHRRLRERLLTPRGERVAERAVREAAVAVVWARNRRYAPTLRHDPAAPVLVLSPHLDDAALDCWSVLETPGAPVTVATVFAGAPRSPLPGRWDRVAGAGDAVALTRARQAEDREARARPGARVVHQRFVDESHRRASAPPSFQAIDAALVAQVPAAALVLAPAVLGVPHPDHAAVRDLALALRRAGHAVRLYADLPYATAYGWPAWARRSPSDPHLDVVAYWEQGGTDPALVSPGRAEVVRLHPGAAARKLQAIRCYRSQFSLLDRGSLGLVSDPRVHGVEVFWSVP
jgi:biofilm PGA synthesis N-glycosyltransferase PgaC